MKAGIFFLRKDRSRSACASGRPPIAIRALAQRLLKADRAEAPLIPTNLDNPNFFITSIFQSDLQRKSNH